MKRLFCYLAFAFLTFLVGLQAVASARGFGGFRGGGGFGGGGFGGGGFRGGGGGGFRGGDFGGGDFGRGGFGGGDFGRGDFGGGDSNRGGFGGEGGFGRSDEGNFNGMGQRASSGYRGGDASGWNRDGSGGGNWGANAGRFGGTVNRGQLNNFLGLSNGAGAGAGAALANHGMGSGQALANYGTHPFSQTWAHSQGNNVQNWASNHPEATQAWTNAKNSWPWNPAGVDAAAWGAAAWTAAGWPTLDNWLGWGDASYYPYDYGDNITYDGDNVYYNSQPAGTAGQYYQEASNLAAATASPSSENSGDWLPLGIFGLIEGDSKTPSRTFQIAVNKDGTIRGNSANQYSNVLPIHGAVQKKTQRVCWTVGTDTTTVYDTGLYNLTKQESPILVHSGPKETRQELFLRMKQPPSQSATGSLGSTK